jgi:hypothetical protein
MRILGTDNIFTLRHTGSLALTSPIGPAKPNQSGGPLPSDVRPDLTPSETSFAKPVDFFNKPVGRTDLEVRVAPPPVVEPPEPPASKASIKEKLSIMLESMSVAMNTSRVGMLESLTDDRRMELGEVGRFFLGRAVAMSAMDMDRLFEILGNLSDESKEGIREGFSLMAEFDFDISNKIKAGDSLDTLERILSFLDPIAECFRSPEPAPAPAPPPPPSPEPDPPLPPTILFPRPIMPVIPVKMQLLGQRSTVFDRLA